MKEGETFQRVGWGGEVGQMPAMSCTYSSSIGTALQPVKGLVLPEKRGGGFRAVFFRTRRTLAGPALSLEGLKWIGLGATGHARLRDARQALRQLQKRMSGALKPAGGGCEYAGL